MIVEVSNGNLFEYREKENEISKLFQNDNHIKIAIIIVWRDWIDKNVLVLFQLQKRQQTSVICFFRRQFKCYNTTQLHQRLEQCTSKLILKKHVETITLIWISHSKCEWNCLYFLFSIFPRIWILSRWRQQAKILVVDRCMNSVLWILS